MSEVALEGADAGPRTVTIERRWAIGGAVATAAVIAALAVALIVSGGDGRDAGPEGFGSAGFGTSMGPADVPYGAPGMPPQGVPPEGMEMPPGEGVVPEGMPAPPEGALPEALPTPPESSGGGNGTGNSGAGGSGT
jgi:hypothetical protein